MNFEDISGHVFYKGFKFMFNKIVNAFQEIYFNMIAHYP